MKHVKEGDLVGVGAQSLVPRRGYNLYRTHVGRLISETLVASAASARTTESHIATMGECYITWQEACFNP